MVDDALGGVKDAHDDVPCVADNENGKRRLENPAEEHGAVEVVHIVFLCYHLYQLHAHDTGKDGRCDRQHHRFRQVLQHIENAAVPRLRGGSHIGGDFSDFGIYIVKQPGQVARDAVD